MIGKRLAVRKTSSGNRKGRPCVVKDNRHETNKPFLPSITNYELRIMNYELLMIPLMPLKLMVLMICETSSAEMDCSELNQC